MKGNIFHIIKILLVLQSYLYGQVFTELKGLDDEDENTHLFYRIYKNGSGMGYDWYTRNIRHWDLTSNSDSIKMVDDFSSYFMAGQTILDYEFLSNDPDSIVGVGYSTDVLEPLPLITGAITNNDFGFSFHNTLSGIAISSQNSNLVYIDNHGNLIYSTNQGKVWFTPWEPDPVFIEFGIYAVDKWNDKKLFGHFDNKLVLSNDSGYTKTVIDSTIFYSDFDVEFFFDPDTSYIYLLNNRYSQKNLMVSSNGGYSWDEKFAAPVNIEFSNNAANTGEAYLAINDTIYRSYDHFQNYEFYIKLDENCVGLYKKPNSDLLYAATYYNIYEIENGIKTSIKEILVSVDETKKNPLDFILLQNYPNPFNPSTIIKFTVAEALNASTTNVLLKVYDILGNEISVLVDEQKSPGTYEVEFDSKSVNRRISNGIYFYRLEAGNFTQSRKMILLK
ncbi:MAG: T9SS type A sorting domain-containing protein [Ignavibacteriae bacterium]|nr:T9SS type A sorting domain-containing protein [Ignavibacteriota bacterium]